MLNYAMNNGSNVLRQGTDSMLVIDFSSGVSLAAKLKLLWKLLDFDTLGALLTLLAALLFILWSLFFFSSNTSSFSSHVDVCVVSSL